MMDMELKNIINTDKTSLGIELGSTRIKSVLIGSKGEVIATGYYSWENKFKDGIWTYDLQEVWTGIQSSYAEMKKEVKNKYGSVLHTIGSIGVSAMMHGYLVFDKNNYQLVEFRTWRNTMTEEAQRKLTDLFEFNIPQRWSVAHLYQAILNNEKHVNEIDYMTTLAGYVHWKLTGEKVLGVGDASGMFPINQYDQTYDFDMIRKFTKNIAEQGYTVNIESILPKILIAGDHAGSITSDGVLLLDPSGNLTPGIKMAPPEGDAGTGMVATNSISKNTGNLSAGTSAFLMIVLSESLKNVYPEIDVVVTPSGLPVAMVHANNCTTEINEWVNVFKNFVDLLEIEVSKDEIYKVLFNAAISDDNQENNIISYGYHSGENITNIKRGRPLLVRTPESEFTINSLMKSILNGSFATINIGLSILEKENVIINNMMAHGGIFKTDYVAQKIVASAIGSPVSVMETANEGGAWGMALLARYTSVSNEMSLEDFLNNNIFIDQEIQMYKPTEQEIDSYSKYIENYKKGLEIEKTAELL